MFSCLWEVYFPALPPPSPGRPSTVFVSKTRSSWGSPSPLSCRRGLGVFFIRLYRLQWNYWGIVPFCSQIRGPCTRYLRISSHLKRILLGNHQHPHPHHHPHDCDQDGLIREEARTERVGKDWFSITRRIFLPHTIFYHLPPDLGPAVFGGRGVDQVHCLLKLISL